MVRQADQHPPVHLCSGLPDIHTFHLPPSFRHPHTVCFSQGRAICFKKENKPVAKVLSMLGLEDRGYPEILQMGELE